MFEEELMRGAGEGGQRRAFEGVPPGRQQIEGERHAGKEVCRQPLRVDERADFVIGSLAPGSMSDLGGEEIAPGFACRLRDAAAEFAPLAVLVDIAADRQVPVFAPERLEQTGGRNRVSSGSWTRCFLRTLAGMSGSW